MQGVTGSNPVVSTTSERTLLRSDFCLHKNHSPAPSFLLFREKSRSVACSFVNALETAHTRYQLFTILRLRRSQNPLPLLRLRASPVRIPVPVRVSIWVLGFLCAYGKSVLRHSNHHISCGGFFKRTGVHIPPLLLSIDKYFLF